MELAPLSSTQGECLCEITATLITLFSDKNKRVQGAAFSAIACYLEDVPHLLYLNPALKNNTPFITALIHSWHLIVPEVQSKNKLALLDCISTFSDCLTESLAIRFKKNLQDIQILMSDVLLLVNDTSEFSTIIFPVLKTLEQVLYAFKILFQNEPSLLNFVEKAFVTAWTFTTEALTLPDGSEEAYELEDLGLAALHLLQFLINFTSEVTPNIGGNTLAPLMDSLLTRERDPDWQQLFQRALSQGIAPPLKQATIKLIKELLNHHPSFALKYKSFFAAM